MNLALIGLAFHEDVSDRGDSQDVDFSPEQCSLKVDFELALF